jgi:hypothetical protein
LLKRAGAHVKNNPKLFYLAQKRLQIFLPLGCGSALALCWLYYLFLFLCFNMQAPAAERINKWEALNSLLETQAFWPGIIIVGVFFACVVRAKKMAQHLFRKNLCRQKLELLF